MRTIQMTLDDDLVKKVDAIANDLNTHLLGMRCGRLLKNITFAVLT